MVQIWLPCIRRRNWCLRAGLLTVSVLTMLCLIFYCHRLSPWITKMAATAKMAAIGSDLPLFDGDSARLAEEDCELCNDNSAPRLHPNFRSSDVMLRQPGEERVEMSRHFGGPEPWPEIQLPRELLPGQMPPTLHYVWCKPGEVSLGFHHYLGVLSAIRVVQPIKFIFHYHTLPRMDHNMYYTWFLELKQSVPSLVLRALPKDSPSCGSSALLALVLSLLQQDGGIFLGSNVIVSRLPRGIIQRPLWFAFSHAPRAGNSSFGSVDVMQGVIIAKQGFDDAKKGQYLQDILSSKPECVSPDVFNAHTPDSEKNAHCIVVPDKPDVYPIDIMYANTSFAQLSRWLYYGKRSAMYPKTNPEDPIPRISHMIWFSKYPNSPSPMAFYQFLAVLSALYVGGFRHVYIHGNAGFKGPWWQKLANENVTFVRIEEPEVVYQQGVREMAHKSDVTRLPILYKYGGAYSDFEAMWTMRVPDWLLNYPCVATSDWAKYGEFPDCINNGVLLAKRHAPWLRHHMAAHRYYVDANFIWNSILMSYRTFERHPDQLFFYRHLQVMCDFGICHPSWHPGWRRNVNDHRPTKPFDWRTETLAVHVTRPDPETSFISPENLRKGTDMFADIGRHILEKSGRLGLLGKNEKGGE